MLGVGDKFPAFSVTATVSREVGKEFDTITDASYPGKWKVYFFWPMDFTFVCPTEISAFGDLAGEFASRGAQLLGGSTDSEFVHLAWRNNHPALRDLPVPMLADKKQDLGKELGVLHKGIGMYLRATYIVDPEGTIRYVGVNDLPVGRNPQEVLRLLDALQTGELTPCNWKKGEATL